jgi:hypothetical protein
MNANPPGIIKEFVFFTRHIKTDNLSLIFCKVYTIKRRGRFPSFRPRFGGVRARENASSKWPLWRKEAPSLPIFFTPCKLGKVLIPVFYKNYRYRSGPGSAKA